MYKKYFMPILVLLILSLGLRWLEVLLTGQIGFIIITILRASLLFWFGLTLNVSHRRRNEKWFRKVLISFVFIFFLVWDLGYIMIPELKAFFNNIGLYGYIVYLIYIYCGWAFFDWKSNFLFLSFSDINLDLTNNG